MMNQQPYNRRQFIKKVVMGGCGIALGAYTVKDLLLQHSEGLRIGFRNDAPSTLWKWSKEAQWYENEGRLLRCVLCPHQCILGENDRGLCRVRVVKEGKMHSLVYGNPCAVHIDPIEKKPFFHFMPSSFILSIATAGCNLRCMNCQNWEISQSKPHETENFDLLPEKLVSVVSGRGLSSIAYTYSEPIIYYEYVYDTAQIAREQKMHNVLVSAGYIMDKPLRKLCKVVDAATVDLKAFNDSFYKKVTNARLKPILHALEIMREEGIWLELSRLIVPTLSDDMKDLREMCRWIVKALGPGTPLHFLRFHPAHKLMTLPPTPLDTMTQARDIAHEEGLHYVYLGNVPEYAAQDTICPECKRHVIERRGYYIPVNLLKNGQCPCGEHIPGVWGPIP